LVEFRHAYAAIRDATGAETVPARRLPIPRQVQKNQQPGLHANLLCRASDVNVHGSGSSTVTGTVRNMKGDTMSNPLSHPLVAAERDRLVAAGRGVLVYEVGCGGREAVIAAGVELASRTGTELVGVDAAVHRVLWQQLVEQLAPDLPLRFVSAERLARDPDACAGASVLAASADSISPGGQSGRHVTAAMAAADHPLLALHPWSVRSHTALIAVVCGVREVPPVRLSQAALLAAG
jgi:hypothetical protein